MLKNEKGEVLAVSYINRVANIGMEGTYGYMKKSFRERGGAMLTATSVVEEFLIERMEEVDLPHFGRQYCYVGTDYYGREMTLPISRIRSVTFKDTEDQGKLRGLNGVLKSFDELKEAGSLQQEQEALLAHYLHDLMERRQKLVAAGVTEYEPKRAGEDEL